MEGQIEIETPNERENEIWITNEAKVQMYAGDRGTTVWATVTLNHDELRKHIDDLIGHLLKMEEMTLGLKSEK